jgi:transposase
MIQIPANANILIMHEPISFRAGIDGTAAVARVVLQKEPMDGAFFVFRNKGRHMLRILYYDGSGFWICTKRLSKGCFSAWPAGDGTGPCCRVAGRRCRLPAPTDPDVQDYCIRLFARWSR